jgi:eukaryotic-like serine/threonine-protein kinase
MDWLKNILTNKFLYISIASICTAGILTILLIDNWIMPAYTNYNEGVTVPDLTKLSLDEARSLLELYGLRYEILDRRAHSAYPADYIIDQSPSARQIVKPNRKIYLTVNTDARPTVVVPDVVDMSLRNARIQLENSGLEVGIISMESGRFRNTVLRQSISPSDTVDQGAVVDLAVSDGLGEEMVDVPDIIGLSLQDAQQQILAAGLRIGQYTFQPDRETIPNTVLSYSPERNQLREGREIDLIVSERWDAQEVDEAGAVIEGEADSEDPDPDDFENNDETEVDNEGN